VIFLAFLTALAVHCESLGDPDRDVRFATIEPSAGSAVHADSSEDCEGDQITRAVSFRSVKGFSSPADRSLSTAQAAFLPTAVQRGKECSADLFSLLHSALSCSSKTPPKLYILHSSYLI